MRLILASLIALVVLAVVIAPAVAANPHANGTTGQPNQSCEESQPGPPGFNSGGFANAEEHYAGNGKSAAHANSDHAVSQYDVACFQVSQH
jgi:hypothetical protein